MTDSPLAASEWELVSCPRCNEREGVVETAGGDYICQECYEVLADRAYEAMKERLYGDQ